MSSKIGEPSRADSAAVVSRRSRFLATRLFVWYACSGFTLVCAATAFLHWGLDRNFEAQSDGVLLERIQVLRSLLRDAKEERAELRWEIESEQEGFPYPEIYLRVLDQRQVSLLETPGMSQFLPPEAFPGAVGLEEQPKQGLRVAGQSGRVFRVMAAAATVPVARGGSHVIQAAVDVTSEEAALRGIHWPFAVVVGGSALISLGLGYRITRRGLRPLREIVAATQRIRSSTLDERIDIAGLPAELAILADNFNDMLDRLEESFTHLSRFSADIAHELRTPLNNLRIEAELALTRVRSAEAYREVLASSLEEYANLSRIVERLLFIALAERSDAPIDRERINVVGELRALVDFYEPVAAEKGLALGVESTGELWMDLDRVLFRRAAGNLVANAVAYTPTGGTISLTAAQQGSAIRVEVSDTGVGIGPEHLPHIFDRFYRVERARCRSSGGVGLGLSIVKSVMDLHGGSAEIASQPGRGTRVALTFPQITKS